MSLEFNKAENDHLSREVNDEMLEREKINLEDTIDLKEDLISIRESLKDTIIIDKEDFYE